MSKHTMRNWNYLFQTEIMRFEIMNRLGIQDWNYDDISIHDSKVLYRKGDN